jgi:integrase
MTKSLTSKAVERLINRPEPGRYRDYGDGAVKGLLLIVKSANNASWTLRFEKDGRERWMGLGSAREFGLKEARGRARAARQMLADGIDPLEAKRSKATAQALERAKSMSFQAAAMAYFDSHQNKWARKSREQFSSSLRTFAFPHIGSLPVASIDVTLVLKCLEQPYAGGRFWDTRPTTAGRVRSRIEQVLDWAEARNLRAAENPARWKRIKQVLPAKHKLRQHHPALPHGQVPEFMERLRNTSLLAARALEFTVLTASRSGETRFAVWSEFDLKAAIWTVPPERMKSGRQHKVPLAPRVIELLSALPTLANNDRVFVGTAGGGLGSGAMAAALKQLNPKVTIHGFRSSFRDWCAERTNFPREVAELCLAHHIAGAVERAYLRSDMIAQRRRLMEQWAAYCTVSAADETGAAVIPLNKRTTKQTKLAAT